MLQHFRLGCRLHCKKILYTASILLLGHLFLFGNVGRFGSLNTSQTVFAQSTNTADGGKAEANLKENVAKWTEYCATLSKTFYIVLWPLLVVAGFAMDNSMIYGANFGFDVALWHLRNLTKNIANFALGFLFLYGIFRILIGKSDAKEMAKLIKNTLIAGVLIQSSRFLTATAIDISTIATYGIGGLPLSIVGKVDHISTEEKSMRFPGMVIYVPVDSIDPLALFLTTNDTGSTSGRSISPCETYEYSEGKETERLIIGRSYINYGSTTGKIVPTQPGICHYWGGVYRFKDRKEPITENQDTLGWIGITLDNTTRTGQNNYKTSMKGFAKGFASLTGLQKKEEVTKLITGGKILQMVTSPTRLFSGNGPNNMMLITGTGRGYDNGYERLAKETGGGLTTFDTLLKKSKSYVGVFSALYGSLIDTSMIEKKDGGMFSAFLTTLVNAAYVAVLILPLAVLAIVLMARIAMLWVIVAVSPLIVLLHVFKDTIKVDAITGDKSLLSLKNIGSLLLAPVLISFALSLSTIFMATLKQMEYGKGEALPTNILGLFEVNIQGTGADASEWLIKVMGIGIVRFLLFRAIKQNKIGESIGGAVQKTATRALMNAPIIPIGDGLGLKQIDPSNPNGILGTLDKSLNDQLESGNNETVAKILKEMGLEDYADQTALKNVETKRQTSVGKMITNKETGKTVFDAWKTSGRNDDFTVTRTNERGEKEEVEFKANDISANPDHLKHFMEWSKALSDAEKDDKHKGILKQFNDEIISNSKDASDEKTLKQRIELTTEEQRTKLSQIKPNGRTFGTKKYTINKDATQDELSTYLKETSP